MLIAGKIDGALDLLHFLWVLMRALVNMGAEHIVVFSLVGVLLLAGLFYFVVRSREA